MSSEITKDNLNEILSDLAREYRKCDSKKENCYGNNS